MKKRAKKLISIVIPAYNEASCIDELCARLREIFSIESNYSWECLIIENGSSDQTFTKLLQWHSLDKRFKILKLSRNFGMDGGLTAGINYVHGDALILMAADLQDPPELIPNFLRKWENGYQNIYGVIQSRKGSNRLRRINSWLFYKIAFRLSNGQIIKNASDFRLVDKKVYMAVREMQERNRFVRGLFSWVGFKSFPIELHRPVRYAGKSNAKTLVVLDLAIKGILGNSYKPLKIISLFGSHDNTIEFKLFLSTIFSSFQVFALFPFRHFCI
jgi:dolichol-phosphate mannosyltransferase